MAGTILPRRVSLPAQIADIAYQNKAAIYTKLA
jgi:hypothetical protein